MERNIEVGKIYRHFKGTYHKVIALAKHSETLEDMVVYTHEENPQIWVRPVCLFLEKVDNQKYPNCKQVYRFEEVNETCKK